MDKLQNELTNRFSKERVKQNEPLTNIYPKINLTAPLFLSVNEIEELTDAVQICQKLNIEYFLLDLDIEKLNKKTDVNGLIIKNDTRKLEIIARKGKIQSQNLITDYVLIESESGVSFSRLIRFSIEESLGGVEDGFGIKGSLQSVFEYEKDYIEKLANENILQSIKILNLNGEIEDVNFDKKTKYLLVLSAIFKLRGEDKKILWLKAQKAAAKRGVMEFNTY